MSITDISGVHDRADPGRSDQLRGPKQAGPRSGWDDSSAAQLPSRRLGEDSPRD